MRPAAAAALAAAAAAAYLAAPVAALPRPPVPDTELRGASDALVDDSFKYSMTLPAQPGYQWDDAGGKYFWGVCVWCVSACAITMIDFLGVEY